MQAAGAEHAEGDAMTDPMEMRAPERVYLDGDATVDEGYWPRCFGTPKPCSAPALEYIRADLVAALVAEAVAKEREACVKVVQSFSRTKTYSDEFLGTITGRTLTSGDRVAAAIRNRNERK